MTQASKGSGKRARRAVSAEFKVEAVRLMRERQKLGVSVAQGPGVGCQAGSTVEVGRQVEERAGGPRDFFKKRAAFFAKESR